MAQTWKPVFSKMAQEIGYDDETGELLVRWTNGRVSAYADVPPALVDELQRAPSVGEMINSDIKGKYAHRYVG